MPDQIIQRSFAGGEIAPALYGRADQTKYATGLKTCRNFVVLKHGGVGTRGGTKFIAEVKNSLLETYLIKFVFNNEQSYLIEVGNQYMRFIRDGAQIVVSGVTAYNGGTAYVVGDLASSGGVNYYCIAATTGNAPPNATYWYALTGDIYEIPTPYLTADLKNLQFVQSGDVVTIVHETYPVYDLSRTGHTAWTLVAKTFEPSISAPPGATNNGTVGTGGDAWVVTASKEDTYEESVASPVTETSDVATTGAPISVGWTLVTGAAEYNVYKRKSGVYGYVGTGIGTFFTDNGIIQDMSRTPPITRNPFASAGQYPAAITYYQQRLMLANQNNDTEKIHGSRSGNFGNFTLSSPLQADDAISFRIAGRQVNAVRHMIDVGALIVLTQSGEFLIEGDANGALLATQPANPRQIGYNGASRVIPVIINDSALYVQARGAVVRDLRYTVNATGGASSYKGRDLTVFSTHLFLHKAITRMDFAQNRNSVAYCVRDDGVLLGLTYLTEHEIWGWHRHDTDGLYEDVCVVPEDDLDVPYFIVNRDGGRYIERESDRDFTDIEVDATFLDSYLTYDGRHTGSTFLRLSASDWTVDGDITVTASGGTPFVAGDVGNEVVFWIGTERVKITIDTYTSNVIVSGRPDRDIPISLRNVSSSTWGRAVDQVSGLDHLEGKDVAVFADGNVIASPNNADYSLVTVSGGAVTLDAPYLVIHVGLGYVCDMQTLDLDIEGQQFRASMKNVNGVSILTDATRGLFAGPSSDDLDEFTPSAAPLDGEPLALESGLIELPIAATWNQSGSVFVRQKDPLPATILSIIPTVSVGG